MNHYFLPIRIESLSENTKLSLLSSTHHCDAWFRDGTESVKKTTRMMNSIVAVRYNILCDVLPNITHFDNFEEKLGSTLGQHQRL